MKHSTNTPFTYGLLAALFAQSGLCAPARNEHLAARASSTTPGVAISTVTLSPSLQPEIIQSGPLSDAEIQKLVDAAKVNTAAAKIDLGKEFLASLGARGAIKPEPLPRSKRATSGPFQSYFKAADGPPCPNTLVNGPMNSLDVITGSTHMRGLKFVSISGNNTDILGAVDPDGSQDFGVFEFQANERVTEFIVKEALAPNEATGMGFSFKTDAGRSYDCISKLFGAPADPAFTFKSVPLNVGSGIIARAQGSVCGGQVLNAFGIDFLDDLQSIDIINMTYSGFTNNIAPSASSSSVTIGSVTLDNRNSSSQQSMTMTTIEADTSSSTFTTTDSWKVGASVSITAGASIPFLSKGEATASSNWEVAGSDADAEMVSKTVTRSATFPLVCGPGKFCIGSASFLRFTLDVNMEATFAATTKSGQVFTWVQKGTFKGSDSLNLKLVVREIQSPTAEQEAGGSGQLTAPITSPAPLPTASSAPPKSAGTPESTSSAPPKSASAPGSTSSAPPKSASAPGSTSSAPPKSAGTPESTSSAPPKSASAPESTSSAPPKSASTTKSAGAPGATSAA